MNHDSSEQSPAPSEWRELLGRARQPGRAFPEFDAVYEAAIQGDQSRTRLSEIEVRQILKSSPGRLGRRLLAVAAVAVLGLGVLFALGYQGILIPGAGPSGEVVAVVLSASGSVSVSAGDGSERPAGAGEGLHVGETIQTGPDSRVELAIKRGSVVRIMADSHFSVEHSVAVGETGRETQTYLERGRLYAVVERTEAESSFDVRTPTAIAGVRGTSFRVSVGQDTTEVYVVRGSVEVARTGALSEDPEARTASESIVLEQSELAIVGSDAAPEYGERPAGEFIDERELESLSRHLSTAEATVAPEFGMAGARAQAQERRAQMLQIVRFRDGRPPITGIVVSQGNGQIYVETEEGGIVLDQAAVRVIEFPETPGNP